MASIQDRGKGVEKRWQARYRDPDGRQVSRSFRRKIDASRWLDGTTADIVTGKYVDPRAGSTRLADYARSWLAMQTFDVSTMEATERRLRLHILPQLGGMEMGNIRPSTVQSWLAGLDGAPSSVRVMLVNLSQILSAAVDDRLIASNPCRSKSVRPPKVEQRRVEPWTVETVQSLVESHRTEYHAIPVVGAGCGLRQGEIFGLQAGDVDFLRRRVLVRRQVKLIDGVPTLAAPKGGKEREVPMPDWVSVALSKVVNDGQVFTWRDGNLIHRTYYNALVWRPALRAVGIEPSRGTGMHQLRHHYASVLLDSGVSIKAVSEALGHASAKTTLDIYAHLMPDTDDRTRQAVDSAHAPVEPSLNEVAGTD